MDTGQRVADFTTHRWKLLIAIAGGTACAVLSLQFRLLPGSEPLIGWIVGAAIFIFLSVRMFLTADEARVRRNAAKEDQSRGILTTVMLTAVTASIGVAILALRDTKLIPAHSVHNSQPWVLVLATLTLVTSWMIAQCLFVLHYAHRYFGDSDRDGASDGGIKFPGEPPTTYRDFIYVAVCVGATCQVSDFNITTSRFRNLVTAHALFAFAFNTMVLALGINIIAGLLGQ